MFNSIGMKRQLQLYGEQRGRLQNQLDELHGDAPETEIRRRELTTALHDIDVRVEDINTQLMREGVAPKQDFFND